MNNDVQDYFFLKQNFRSTEKGSTGQAFLSWYRKTGFENSFTGLKIEMWRVTKNLSLNLTFENAGKMVTNGWI